MIDIKGLDQGHVLKVLHDSSRVQGLGWLAASSVQITIDECRELLVNHSYFDYLRGKVMKIQLGGDQLDPRLYDRDNGQGAAARAIDTIR